MLTRDWLGKNTRTLYSTYTCCCLSVCIISYYSKTPHVVEIEVLLLIKLYNALSLSFLCKQRVKTMKPMKRIRTHHVGSPCTQYVVVLRPYHNSLKYK